MGTVASVLDLELARAKKMTAVETAISITDDFNAIPGDPRVNIIDICLPLSNSHPFFYSWRPLERG